MSASGGLPTTTGMQLRRALIGVALLAAAARLAAHDREDSWTVRETRPLHETYAVAPGTACHVIVDNLEGAITVTPAAGSQVVMRAQETVRARTAEDAAQARREVRLDVDQRGGAIEFFVDGPFRCRDGRRDEGANGRWDRWCDSGRRRYAVAYDFTLEVPRRCDLELATVNRGDVEVRGVSGAFDVQNVNGAIALEGVAGSGRAHTVNGGVTARFAALPDGPLDFETVNGDVDVGFGAGLAADFLLRTFSGEMWSDFDYSSLPVAVESERQDGRFVYSQKGTTIRVGRGGHRVRLVTLNGDIVIRRVAP